MKLFAIALVLLGFSVGHSFSAPPAGYSLETIDGPKGIAFEICGLSFSKEGTLYVTTRLGEVWKLKPGGTSADWQLFADGLQEPLGILADQAPAEVLVVQRTELTKLLDANQDGVAEEYRRVNGDWGFSGNYHEYAHGLVRDPQGNLFLTLNLAHSKGLLKGNMSRPAPYRGWTIKITPDGKFEPFACGFRSPMGVGMSPQGELFVCDSQGEWMPTSPLFHVREGKFYGSPDSLADHPDFKGKDMQTITKADFETRRTLPAVWIPHGEVANSPGQPVFDNTNGKFGPFEGQIFMGDHTKSNVLRVALEKVGGEYQGALFTFCPGLKSGYIRGTFAPDGSFWMGEVDHGWGTAGGRPFALERLKWDGSTIPFEMHTVQLDRQGFVIHFTKPINPATAKADGFKVQHWHYNYHHEYGSKKVEEMVAQVDAVEPLPDGKSLLVKVPLLAGRVYRLDVPVAGAAGERLENAAVWYTLNRLKE